jgi:hypothetical protein
MVVFATIQKYDLKLIFARNMKKWHTQWIKVINWYLKNNLNHTLIHSVCYLLIFLGNTLSKPNSFIISRI